MKRMLLGLAVVALVVEAAVGVPTVTVDRGGGALYDSVVGGGEMRVVPNPDLMAITAETGPFLTFCVEKHEPVDVTGGTTYFASVLTEAILGNWNDGPTGPTGHDALDSRTAYLYSQFRSGALVIDTTAKAGNLQSAIWYIEDEYDDATYQLPLSALTPGAQAFVTLANANDPGTIGNVRVLHLWTETTPGKPDLVQDMLTLVPVSVPAPGALLLAGIGTAVVGWLRRRRAV